MFLSPGGAAPFWKVMSKTSRAEKQERELQLLEQEFRGTLMRALKSCTDGGRGVFLTTQEAARTGYSRFVWAETKQLEDLGKRIVDLRTSIGLPLDESVCGVFLKYCQIAGPNAPGASKLALECLKELGASS
jgi:hypothetical protein